MIPLSINHLQHFRTPRWLRRAVIKRWRPTVDAAATDEDKIVRAWWGPGSKHPNSLKPGFRWKAKRIFCNPPWMDAERACRAGCTKKRCPKRGFHLTEDYHGIAGWLDKGYRAVVDGEADLVIYLLPANVGAYWYRLYAPHARTIFLSPRVAYETPAGIVMKQPPTASMIMVMDGEALHQRQEETPIRASVWYVGELAKVGNDDAKTKD